MAYMCELLKQLPQWALGAQSLRGNSWKRHKTCVSDSMQNGPSLHLTLSIIPQETGSAQEPNHPISQVCRWLSLSTLTLPLRSPLTFQLKHPSLHTHTHTHTHTDIQTHTAALLLLLFSPCFIFFRKSASIPIITIVEYPEVNFNHKKL